MGKIRFSGCMLALMLGLSFCSDATPEEDALDENEVSDLTSDDASEDDAVEDDLDIAGDGGNGCDQDVPDVAATVLTYCGDRFAGSCLFTGCDECQVCYTDISCGIPDPSVDTIPCGCYGTGQCHTLCASAEDCAESEECINLGWFAGHDVSCAYRTRVCWPISQPDPPFVCP